jgi:hypothetical protein
VELETLGFDRKQCRVPALLIPLYNAAGEPAGYQARADRCVCHQYRDRGTQEAACRPRSHPAQPAGPRGIDLFDEILTGF